MTRFCGLVGYEEAPHEDPTNPGVWLPTKMIEKKHFGTIRRNQRKWDNPVNTSTNDDLNVTNRISIVGNAYANEHWPTIKYVRFGGACWKVLSVDVLSPRLVLNLGGVWNGPTDSAS